MRSFEVQFLGKGWNDAVPAKPLKSHIFGAENNAAAEALVRSMEWPEGTLAFRVNDVLSARQVALWPNLQNEKGPAA